MPKDNSAFFEKKTTWSETKDRLLGCYLPQYFQKVLMTHKPIFYVDCFAGKGRFNDGKDGSPRIALKIREDCIGRTNSQNARIDSCFIDLNYADELKTNISEFSTGGTLDVISGKYEDEIEGLLSRKRGVNVFLYIDPYGIKALDCSLFDKFAGQGYGFGSIEMLINMNSFGFMRAACRAMRVDYNDVESFDELVEYDPTIVDTSSQSIQTLTDIAGGDYWQAIVRDYNAGVIDGYQAERRFSTEYKQRLRKSYMYVLDMPIRLKPGQRPKYRMIHVTNHEAGCILMADNMSARSDELFIEIQHQGQLSLFDHNTENEVINTDEIRHKVSDFLRNFPQGMTADKLIALFFTQQGVLCKSGVIRDIWKDMEKCGTIEVTRTPATTITGRRTTFFTEGKGQSVLIRRKP